MYGDREITDEEKEKIEEKIHELNIEQRLQYSIENEFKEDSFEDIREEYGYDIESRYKKTDRESTIKEIRLDNMERLKSTITLGVKKTEQIEQIKCRIIGNNEERMRENTNLFIYGNSWYIEYDGEYPTIYTSKDLTIAEIVELKETLKEEIERICGTDGPKEPEQEEKKKKNNK